MNRITSVITLMAFLFASVLTAGGIAVACYHPDGRFCIETVSSRCCESDQESKTAPNGTEESGESDCNDCIDVKIDLPVQQSASSAIELPSIPIAFLASDHGTMEAQVLFAPISRVPLPPMEDSRCAILRAVIFLC